MIFEPEWNANKVFLIVPSTLYHVLINIKANHTLRPIAVIL